ncbi:hypothetical protein IAG44_35530 [Streptomyces roseirectus]|uniref:Uncharacterized protein n=1 Tax=Streptomyces roseirectus TaxID=2768066 RepID=A0A7H0IN80_9ACTN|nr:hypothetical protein [Streptomyces roseirectus]QNP74246.1 hypothetical protein IAG44_35530 [Streptomyces roseirectus]
MLDETMTALAASVGAGVVQAAGTDAWAGFRDRLARVLGRADREAVQAGRLERTAAELAEAGPPGADGEARARHSTVWRTRTEDLLEDLPPGERALVAGELRALLDEAARASRGGVTGNVFHGAAAVQSGDGNVQVNRFGSRP